MANKTNPGKKSSLDDPLISLDTMKTGLKVFALAFPPAAPFVGGFLALGGLLKAKSEVEVLGLDPDPAIQAAVQQCINEFLDSGEAEAIFNKKKNANDVAVALDKVAQDCLKKIKDNIENLKKNLSAWTPAPGLYAMTQTEYDEKTNHGKSAPDGFTSYKWAVPTTPLVFFVVNKSLYSQITSFWQTDGSPHSGSQWILAKYPLGDNADDVFAWLMGLASNGDLGFYWPQAGWRVSKKSAQYRELAKADVKAGNFGESTIAAFVDDLKVAGQVDDKNVVNLAREIRRVFGDPNWEQYSPPAPQPKGNDLVQRAQSWWRKYPWAVAGIGLAVVALFVAFVAWVASSRKAAA